MGVASDGNEEIRSDVRPVSVPIATQTVTYEHWYTAGRISAHLEKFFQGSVGFVVVRVPAVVNTSEHG